MSLWHCMRVCFARVYWLFEMIKADPRKWSSSIEWYTFAVHIWKWDVFFIAIPSSSIFKIWNVKVRSRPLQRYKGIRGINAMCIHFAWCKHTYHTICCTVKEWQLKSFGFGSRTKQQFHNRKFLGKFNIWVGLLISCMKLYEKWTFTKNLVDVFSKLK